MKLYIIIKCQFKTKNTINKANRLLTTSLSEIIRNLYNGFGWIDSVTVSAILHTTGKTVFCGFLFCHFSFNEIGGISGLFVQLPCESGLLHG